MRCWPARLEDIDGITAIHAACFGAKAWPRADFEKALTADTDQLTCIYKGQTLCGFSHLRGKGDSAEILTFGIDPRNRDKGFGAALLSAALERANEAGADEVLLDVRQDNIPAISLYRRAGFERIGKRKNYYKDTVDGRPVYTDAHVYKKALSSLYAKRAAG